MLQLSCSYWFGAYSGLLASILAAATLNALPGRIQHMCSYGAVLGEGPRGRVAWLGDAHFSRLLCATGAGRRRVAAGDD